MLCEGDTFGINGSFGATGNQFSINFSKAKTKFSLSLSYNGDNTYLFVERKEMFTFKANEKMLINFAIQFCLGSISNELCAIESREVSLKRNVYNFFSQLQCY